MGFEKFRGVGAIFSFGAPCVGVNNFRSDASEAGQCSPLSSYWPVVGYQMFLISELVLPHLTGNPII
jgi:hypothetical protein